MNVMQIEHVTKTFPGVRALDDVTFAIRKGEILGIVGENGAGKSTLMQILSGVHTHGTYAGRVLVEGKELQCRTTRDAEACGIAMIYQELNFHLDTSVAENLFMGDWLTGPLGEVRWKEIYRQSAALLAEVGLEEIDAQMPMRSLSKAQQQMVAIAHALRKNPKVLIMDEPTSTLHKKEVGRLFETIHRLNGEGITVVLITHKMEEVFGNCTRLVVMRNGRFVAEHDIGEVTVDEVISEMVGHSFHTYTEEASPMHAPGEEVLRVEQFTVAHPLNKNKNILEGISFSLHRGEVLALEGLVGAGKTELLSAIFGKGGLRGGKLYLDGRAVRITHQADAIANGIALVTEDRREDGFVDILSILRNIALPNLHRLSRFGVLNRRREQQEAQRYAARLAVKAPSLEVPVGNLSGGNQQKVVLAKWLMSQPKVLLLDDPTRGIDVGAKEEIYKIIHELAESGMAILITSSERSELLRLSDRMIILCDGRISGQLEKGEYDEDLIVNLSVKQ